MNISQQLIILSAELSTNRFEQNRQRTENLAACLDDCHFKYKRATGVYKGNEETSFVVLVNNNTEIDTLRDFAFKNFGQESILYVDSNQEAYLVFPENTEQLGRLEQVSQVDAVILDNYTVMGGKYYATKPR